MSIAVVFSTGYNLEPSLNLDANEAANMNGIVVLGYVIQ